MIRYFVLVLLCCSAYSLTAASEAERVSKDFTKVAKKAIPAVVSIQVEHKMTAGQDPRQEIFEFFQDDFFHHFFGAPGKRGFTTPESRPRQALGSGVIVSSDGLILTNNHVIDNANKIVSKLQDGREFEAKVIGKDANSDLALIQIDADDLPFLSLGDSSQLEVGEWVVAIGNALGLDATLTVGVVSAKGRTGLSISNYEDFIQTDAAINRGNSGGALLNLDGEVVGINTAIASNTGGYMGVGFSIPSNIAKQVMDQLQEKGSVTRGYLGIVLQPIDQDLAEAFQLKKVQGILIAEVAQDSPAQQAGLKPGDVISSYQGKKVESLGSFRSFVSLMSPGTSLNLQVLREGRVVELPVVVGEHPDNQPTVPSAPVGTKVGFSIEPLTADLQQAYGYQHDKGVVVKEVDPQSAAAFAGIKKGALILAVNQKKVTNPEEFSEALQEKGEDKGVLLLVKQSGITRYLYLKT